MLNLTKSAHNRLSIIALWSMFGLSFAADKFSEVRSFIILGIIGIPLLILAIVGRRDEPEAVTQAARKDNVRRTDSASTSLRTLSVRLVDDLQLHEMLVAYTSRGERLKRSVSSPYRPSKEWIYGDRKQLMYLIDQYGHDQTDDYSRYTLNEPREKVAALN